MAEIIVEGRAVPGAPVHRYVPLTARAREELGLVQEVALAEAILRTARWHGFGGLTRAGSRPRDLNSDC